MGHGVVTVDACDETSRWSDDEGYLTNLGIEAKNHCLKLDRMDGQPCEEGNTLWLGACKADDPGFHIDKSGRLVTDLCPSMCAVPATKEAVFTYASRAVALGNCS